MLLVDIYINKLNLKTKTYIVYISTTKIEDGEQIHLGTEYFTFAKTKKIIKLFNMVEDGNR